MIRKMTENAFNADYESQFLFCDYDDLSSNERMESTASARNAARDWWRPLRDAPWTSLDEDDPRRVAFESEWKRWR